MLDLIAHQLLLTAASLLGAVKALIGPAVAFGLLGILVKRRAALDAARAARAELNTNLGLYLLDATVLLPLHALVLTGLQSVFAQLPVHGPGAAFWAMMPQWVVLVAVVFCGDFIGYLRHRIEHTSLLWPAHAVHHSDTHMTWLTLERFHPINAWTTLAIDGLFLSLLGFPAWAIVANQLVRHYYGYVIHADVPWSYGRLAAVFVSPIMHRWHHANDAVAVGKNFATVFSVFDRAFGTYYVPGPCTAPMGVPEDTGHGAVDQLIHPFKVWFARLRSGGKTTGDRQNAVPIAETATALQEPG